MFNCSLGSAGRCTLAAAFLVFFSGFANAQSMQFPKGEFPLTEFQISSVDMAEIMTGGPPKDGIPSIDKPRFVDIEAALEWLEDQEPVISLVVNGEARAYPLQVLMYHEIVNDELGGVPIAVTFCPLCNASIVFERELGKGEDAQLLDFGTTGRLRKSDLIMYDRQTESWWQQFTGRGIIGEFTDIELKKKPSQIISFGEFRKAFPTSNVLSRETGFSRPYGNNPYSGYDSIHNNPFLFRGKVDSRLPAMERVLSLASDTQHQLVPLSQLVEVPVANLLVDDQAIVVFAASTAASALDLGKIAESRQVPAAAAFSATVNEQALKFELVDGVVTDMESGSQWNAFGLATSGEHEGHQLQQVDEGVHFAFAWLAFDPEAKVLDISNN